MKQIKRITLLIALLVMVGLGASVSLKAAIGVGAWDAMAQTFSFLTGIKVGTLGMLFNSLCVLGQVLVLKRNFRWIQLLQLPLNVFLGTIINFFLYEVLGGVTIDSYIVNLALLTGALIFISLAVGAVMLLDVVTFALEGFCMAIAQVTGIGFSKIRQRVDIFSILVILLLTYSFSLPLSLREGTILGMLIFAPLMGFFMAKLRPLFQRLDLLAEESAGAVALETVKEEVVSREKSIGL